MNAPTLAILLASVAGAIGGQVTFKAAMNRWRAARPGVAARARAAAPGIALGFGLYALSTVTWLLALSRVELSVAFPFVSLSHIGILTLARLTLGERLTLPRLTGAALILLGVLCVTASV